MLVTLQAVSAAAAGATKADAAAQAQVAEAIELMRLVTLRLRLAAEGCTASQEISFVMSDRAPPHGRCRDPQFRPFRTA